MHEMGKKKSHVAGEQTGCGDFFTLLQKSLSPFCPLSHSAQRLLEREGERERRRQGERKRREEGREIVRVSNWLAYLSTRRRGEAVEEQQKQ